MVTPDKQKLGKVLFEEGIITQEEIERILSDQNKLNTYIGKVLMSAGNIHRKNLEEFLASTYVIPDFTAKDFTPDKLLVEIIPKNIAEKFELCPVARLDNILVIIRSTYYNLAAIVELRRLTGLKVKVLRAGEDIVRAVSKRLYAGVESKPLEKVKPSAEIEEDKPTQISTPSPPVKIPSEQSEKTIEAVFLSDDLYLTYKRLFNIDLRTVWEKINVVGDTLDAIKIA